MKFFARSVLLSSALLMSLLSPALSVQAAQPAPDDNHVKVQVNSELLSFPDVQPLIDSSHVLQVPVRPVGSKLGYETQWRPVQPNGVEVTLRNATNTFTITTGQTNATLNGKSISLGSAPQLINGSVYIPFRVLADSLKIRIQWDGNNRIAILDEDGQYHAPAWYAPKYQGVIEGNATAYTGSADENGGYANLDYFGNPLQVGTISVDPTVIPLGSKVYVEGYDYDGLPTGGMYATAADTGSAIKGNKIDIYVAGNKTEALQFGVQQVKIYVLK